MKTEKGFWADVLSAWFTNIKLYAKAEIKIIGLIFIIIMLGLNFIGYEMAGLIAVGITLLDLLPVIGSGIIFIPWILFEWILGNPEQGWGLLFLYLFIAIGKQVIEPYFLGKDLELPFWLPIIIIIGSTFIFNIFGIVIASLLIPLIAAYRQVSKAYTR